MIKQIKTGGIAYLQPLTGSHDWYWGTDYTSGDLYEAEDLYRDSHRISSNRLILVHYPDGRVEEPVRATEGQYFGIPAYDGQAPVLLLADFPAGEIRILRYDDESRTVTPIVVLPRSAVEDCYNLILHQHPLCLTREKGERFQVVWPDRADFTVHPAESFCFRDGEELYFSRWYEDPDYREEVVVRHFPYGEIVRTERGAINVMPDGSEWILTD